MRPANNDRDVSGGTYTLILELESPVTVEIGALGTHRLPAGQYAYTGSALGTGGFSRVDRHYELAAGDRSVRHWHIDYLLGHEAVSLRGDVRTPDADIECAVAGDLPDGPVDGFGASDCNCRSHLSAGDDIRDRVAAAHRIATSE